MQQIIISEASGQIHPLYETAQVQPAHSLLLHQSLILILTGKQYLLTMHVHTCMHMIYTYIHESLHVHS